MSSDFPNIDRGIGTNAAHSVIEDADILKPENDFAPPRGVQPWAYFFDGGGVAVFKNKGGHAVPFLVADRSIYPCHMPLILTGMTLDGDTVTTTASGVKGLY